MGEKLVNRDKLFDGMPKEHIEIFDKLLPFEDNTPVEEIKKRKEQLPKEQQEIIDRISREQIERKTREIIECDKKIFRKQMRQNTGKIIVMFLKTPVAKFLYLTIFALLAAKLLG